MDKARCAVQAAPSPGPGRRPDRRLPAQSGRGQGTCPRRAPAGSRRGPQS